MGRKLLRKKQLLRTTVNDLRMEIESGDEGRRNYSGEGCSEATATQCIILSHTIPSSVVASLRSACRTLHAHTTYLHN